MNALARLHDRISHATYLLAVALLAAMMLLLNFEVVARYAMNSPTTWSADLVGYLLLATTFFGLPEVTRLGGHVAITSVIENLPASMIPKANTAISLGGAVVSFVAAWFLIATGFQQFVQGTTTVAVFEIPKWWMTAIVAYGVTDSGFHLVRHSFRHSNVGSAVEI